MKKCTNMVIRNHTYYVRIKVPGNLCYLGIKLFRESLRTNNLNEALDIYPIVAYKIRMRINVLRAMDMEIRNGKLILDDVDIQKMVKSRLMLLDAALNRYSEEIQQGTYDTDALLPFPDKPLSEKRAENPQYSMKEYKLDCLTTEVKSYLEKLSIDHKIPATAFKYLEQVQKGEAEILNKERPEPWVDDAIANMNTLTKYTKNKLEAAAQDIPFNKNTPPLIYSCLQAINEENAQRMNAPVQARTHWTTVFKAFSEKKLKAKGTSQNTVDVNYNCLETIFEIIGDPYVEHVNYAACDKVCNNIGNLPKKWKEKHPKEKLSDLLKKTNEDHISLTSVKKYLGAFKEFMLFSKQRRFTKESFSEDIDIPTRRDTIERDGFTEKELLKIFDSKVYPRRVSIRFGYRYWIPLIALYTGMRLNEICQLYVDDIKTSDDFSFHYFHLTDERKDQHLKNTQSRRDVPIHPMLIKFGFMKFVKQMREEKRERLFYQLNYSKENHYANIPSGWFRRYLTRLGLKSKSKTFHSFRHTVKPYLRNAGVSQEYQNAICGWTSSDIGVKVYGGKVPVEVLYQEIQKLNYPFLQKKLNGIINKNKGKSLK